MNKIAVSEGAVRALRNSMSLLDAAATLFDRGHDAAALVLAVSGREELGRFVLLNARARSMSSTEVVDPGELKSQLDDHEKKLRAGQTGYPVWLKPDLLDSWREAIGANDLATLRTLQPQIDLAKAAVRKREPRETHARRLRAQYVDPQPDGTWRDPSSTTAEDARVAIMTTAAGVANTLIGLQGDTASGGSGYSASLPGMGEFTTNVFGRLARRGA